MKLGYVCTNYNNSHHTVEAVRSLLLATQPQCDGETHGNAESDEEQSGAGLVT